MTPAVTLGIASVTIAAFGGPTWAWATLTAWAALNQLFQGR